MSSCLVGVVVPKIKLYPARTRYKIWKIIEAEGKFMHDTKGVYKKP
jgi:hypothetical protein